MPARELSTAFRTRIHSFTLFIDGLDVFSDAHVDALHEAGCDDATFSARVSSLTVRCIVRLRSYKTEISTVGCFSSW